MMNNRQGGDALINFMAARFQSGGMVAPMKKAASALEKQGRKGDTELVHVTPGELSLLEQIGAGTTNPVTGLREFYAADGVSDGDVGTDTGQGAASPGAANTSDDPGPGSDPDPGGDYNEDDFADEDGFTEGFGGGGAGDRATDAAAESATGISRGGGDDDDSKPSDRTGIVGAIQRALDPNKDGKISPAEVALAGLAAFTPLGPMMALGKGIENLATAVQFGTKPGSEQTGMIADQQRGLYGDEEEDDRGGGGGDEVAAAPEIQEELTIEELTKPPTIDIVPFRPQDFYYLTQQQRQGLPSMMNMRRG